MSPRLLLALFFTMPHSDFAQAIEYPQTRQVEVVDDYHGTSVMDPYQWLEDDNSEETKDWVSAQNDVTRKFLSAIPQRDAIRSRLRELFDYERVGLPEEEGGRWFFTRNSGLQDQPVLYVSDSLDGDPRALIDPNKLSTDGTVALARFQPSEDGRKLAYATSTGGSDWNEIRVRDVDTGEDLPDHLRWVKFSGISWAKDGSGFYYSRYAEPAKGAALTQVNEHQKLYFHRLGSPQSEDRLIYERPDHPRWGLGGWVTEDGAYLIIHLSQGTDPKNRVFYRSFVEGEPHDVVELLPDGDASYRFIGNEGPLFYFLTDLAAPRNRIIEIDIRKPERAAWKEIVPQSEHLLDTASKAGGRLFCTFMRNAQDHVVCYDADGSNPRSIELPGIGSVGGFGGKKTDTHTFYSFNSFTEASPIYRLEIKTGKSELWKRPATRFDSSSFETKQLFFQSKDGTRVPMFVVSKKGVPLDGSSRTLLYGYGGFQISLQPGFSISRAAWLERGGIVAVVNLRGGGEYGTGWHNAGRLFNKQNVFDDFIAAAETLIEKGYTTSSNLAIQGGSNGGLLVGACMTQRPELFGAALPAVGVMDMLRFQKFTIGWAWESEYGSSAKPEEFKNLIAYSPYHNLKKGTRYPATLITTADHDDRVVPAHSFKFAARLQEYQIPAGPPVLIRIDVSAGHGAGTALSKLIDRTADEWAFLEAVLGKPD